MERSQTQEITVAKRNCANSLTQSQRVHLYTVGSFDMLDQFPLKTRVPMERIPVQLAQPSEGGDNLLEIRDLQAKKHLLELGAVQVQTDATIGGGHERVRRVWSVV